MALSAGCAAAEVDRLIKNTDRALATASLRFEAPPALPADPDAPPPGAPVPVARARPSEAAAYHYWTAVAYLGETRRLRARAEFGQALGFARVAQKAVADALRLLEAP